MRGRPHESPREEGQGAEGGEGLSMRGAEASARWRPATERLRGDGLRRVPRRSIHHPHSQEPPMTPDLSAMLHRAREATGLNLYDDHPLYTIRSQDGLCTEPYTVSEAVAFLAGMIACAEWTKRAGKGE